MKNPISDDEKPRTFKSDGIIKSGNFARVFPVWALHPNEGFPLEKKEVYSENVGFRLARTRL
tara:strand:+ start:46 stop:231 length:186 start_codon:yes stop_codon:yes gene_type:complete